MTADQIEREVARCTDNLDGLLMRNQLTQEEYDTAIKRLDRWSEREFLLVPRQATLEGL